MNSIHALILIGLLGTGLSLNAQTDTIPFRLTNHNNMVIEATLNGEDTLQLMFHTAASGMTVIQAAMPRIQSLQFNQQDTVSSWGGDQESRSSTGNSLQIGSLHWDDLTIWENERSGPETDGKFGLDFFADKIIEFNFEERQLVIHETLPLLDPSYEQFALIVDRGLPFLEGGSQVAGELYENRFLIHSGFGGSLLFDDVFVGTHQLGEHLEVISESQLSDSYGNVLKTKKAILPQFQIGEMTLTELPVGFFEGAIARQKMSVIGGDLLKRFHIVLDLQQKHIYLRINSLVEEPYNER